MTYDPFICDGCWGEYGHLPHCPAESGAQGSEPSCDEGNPAPADPKGLPHA
jgi:hypothetical protein